VSKQPVAATDPQIDADPDAPRTARRFSSRFLAELGLDRDARWAPLLVVSELVTNVVRHGGPTLVLSLSSDEPGHLRIAVYDNGVGEVASSFTAGAAGRGLDIVDTLSTSWGVDGRSPGKTVWCYLDIGTAVGF
jgi:anti-sigma regulatory factor (Ser/Thr protein kinase)